MMNKKIALWASLCVLTMVFAVSAQDINTQKFMGEWTLDVNRSELGERSRVESMTMKVSKSELDGKTWLTVTKTTKRAKRQEGERGIRGRMGRGRGGQIDGNNVETVNYDLSGKETKSDVNRGRATGKATAKIKMQKDGSMVIKQKIEINTRRGLRETKNTETWMLSADGGTLTVSNERETPRGNRNSKMVFTKSINGLKSEVKVKTNTAIKGEKASGFQVGSPVTNSSGANQAVKKSRIGGGVINGKAIRLPAPEYPKSARAIGIRGAVQVSVIIDRKGKIMVAEAVSGHPLLRKSAVEAARKAEFRPTLLEGQPVEVSGIIVYNFK